MSASQPGLCRVAVHADTAAADLCLPAALPVATLIPLIVDTLGIATSGAHFRLSRPGARPLSNATTLAQNDILDGTVLLLSQDGWEAPAPRYDDVADAISATLHTAGPSAGARRLIGVMAAAATTAAVAFVLIRNAFDPGGHAETTAAAAAAYAVAVLTSAALTQRISRDPVAGLTLSLLATVFASLAAILVVPGVPGAPHVLLAAMAVAVVSVLAIRLTQVGVTTLTALGCWAVTLALAALAAVTTAAPAHIVGSLTVLAALGLLEAAPRVAILLARLSPNLVETQAGSLDARALRADRWLTSLLAAFSASATTGALVAALADPRAIALAAVTGALLLLRARTTETRRMLVSAVCGIGTTAITFVVAGCRFAPRGPYLVLLAIAAIAAATYFGLRAPRVALSPVAQRGIEAFECLTLCAAVPLTGWVCGAFSAVRGLDLMRLIQR